MRPACSINTCPAAAAAAAAPAPPSVSRAPSHLPCVDFHARVETPSVCVS